MLLGRLPNLVLVDKQHRLTVPGRVREEAVGDDDAAEFYVGCLSDPCLFLHNDEQHRAFLDAFQQVVGESKEERNLKTRVFSSFVPVKADKAGRISVPEYLLKKANIKKEIVVIGMQERTELWAHDNYETLVSENEEQFDESLEAALSRLSNNSNKENAQNDDNDG